MIGLLAEIGFAVLIESIEFWDFSGRRKYGDYLKGIPLGETPLSKREWKAAGRPERPQGLDGTS